VFGTTQSVQAIDTIITAAAQETVSLWDSA
jgi:hypothetical protein